METEKIGIRSLGFSLLMACAVEFGIQPVLSNNVIRPLVLLGAIRLAEIGIFIGIVHYCEKGLRAIGLARSEIPSGIKRGMVWSIGFGAIVGSIAALGLIAGYDVLKTVRSPMPPGITDVLLLLCVGGIIGPFAEEIFFRGILYGFFRRWGMPAAVALSTIPFVILHANAAAIPLTQIAGGAVCAVAYELEDNLLVPASIHIIGNMAIFTLSLAYG